jgi:hypothetical protein
MRGLLLNENGEVMSAYSLQIKVNQFIPYCLAMPRYLRAHGCKLKGVKKGDIYQAQQAVLSI